ncbi:hypothetical protein [Tuwongella immobilis]|uniref:Uncharacterized protein n=1 Tax=Tuwongella immobilis TaxID=692036 RepID=A0A6C2YPV6_9BACT|nr:hypothetical protein [Tuwongella immobilis]VIP03055.1 unnamed protein product [Tuwongella immobilis]VTS03252.1 unnamed protein product [Tuwongella immobilis]
MFNFDRKRLTDLAWAAIAAVLASLGIHVSLTPTSVPVSTVSEAKSCPCAPTGE